MVNFRLYIFVYFFLKNKKSIALSERSQSEKATYDSNYVNFILEKAKLRR